MTPTAGATTAEERSAFERDGFLVRRGLLRSEELALVRQALHEDTAIRRRAYALDDGLGGSTQICVWNHPGTDTLGVLSRLPRTAGVSSELLGGEVYHYHSKVTTKRPGGGGTWAWHQDYGYWYQNGCPRPDMLTVALAVSDQSIENGCIEVLVGSHRCGRLEHLNYGSQTAAERERVEGIRGILPAFKWEASAGDALFFHSNTLHTSAPNSSHYPREVVLTAYNRADNDPLVSHHHPGYSPLEMMDDEALLRHGLVLAGEGRDFLNPEDDRSIDGFATAT